MVVALAALISAARAIDDAGDALCATLPLAGGTLVEHQARLAASSGAAPIILLVERLPAALTAAVDRLRRDGLRVEIARGLADAVDRIHPDEALLVLADGCVADRAVVARMAEAPLPAVLTVPDDADHARFERIDAGARWGGMLLIDGARLRRTAARLGEWDLQSTLLRRAVQEDAARVAAYEDGEALLALPNSEAEAAALDRGLVFAARGPAADWPGRFLFPPIVDLAALPLARQGIEPRWAAFAAAALAFSATPFALYGWRWTALLLLLLSGPVAAIGRRLGEIRLVGTDRGGRAVIARAVAASLALLLLGADLAAGDGWGCVLLAALVPAGMLAFRRERTIGEALGLGRGPLWLASLDGLVWPLLPAALAGRWLGGVAILAAYVAASFAFAQRRIARAIERDSESEGV